MNQAPDAATAGHDASLDPRQAAALLDQTTLRARRRFEPFPPWLLVIRAFLGLAGYGAIWLSVRGQHPYAHPPAVIAPIGIAIGLVNLAATLAVARRATTGITGPSRLRRGEIAIVALVLAGVFVVMGVMVSLGVSHAIVYGLYPATVPLMAGGLTWAAIMAARANWLECGTALAVAAVGFAGLFAGPAGAWAVAGVGVFIVLLGRAAIAARRQRNLTVRHD